LEGEKIMNGDYRIVVFTNPDPDNTMDEKKPYYWNIDVFVYNLPDDWKTVYFGYAKSIRQCYLDAERIFKTKLDDKMKYIAEKYPEEFGKFASGK
jgi:hypothetical protein